MEYSFLSIAPFSFAAWAVWKCTAVAFALHSTNLHIRDEWLFSLLLPRILFYPFQFGAFDLQTDAAFTQQTTHYIICGEGTFELAAHKWIINELITLIIISSLKLIQTDGVRPGVEHTAYDTHWSEWIKTVPGATQYRREKTTDKRPIELDAKAKRLERLERLARLTRRQTFIYRELNKYVAKKRFNELQLTQFFLVISPLSPPPSPSHSLFLIFDCWMTV